MKIRWRLVNDKDLNEGLIPDCRKPIFTSVNINATTTKGWWPFQRKMAIPYALVLECSEDGEVWKDVEIGRDIQ